MYLDGYDDSYPTTAPVMRFEPNQSGLYDLSGNVWEWCEDGWDRGNERRVIRGGSWTIGERGHLLSSGRDHRATGSRLNNGLGFRVVMVVP